MANYFKYQKEAQGWIFCKLVFIEMKNEILSKHSATYTVKVRLLESIFTRYMALFKVPQRIALETSLKRPRQDTCHS